MKKARHFVTTTTESMRTDFNSFSNNARTCILVHPLFGIPYNLFVPYASLYMLSLGVTEKQIGNLAALGMILQTFWALTAGLITDRFGRRKTSLFFDIISWSLPAFILAFAQNITWFLAATILNSFVRIVAISWTCLLTEGTEKKLRVKVYSWIAIANTLAGFFSPLAGLLVGKLGLVKATRILYFSAFVMMTGMFILRNTLLVETPIGTLKINEAKSKTFKILIADYAAVFKTLIRNRQAIIAFFLLALSSIHLTTRNNFLSVILTKGIGISNSLIAIFPPMAAGATFIVYFIVLPRIKNIRKTLFIALVLNVLGNLMLFFAPNQNILIVILSTIITAIGMGITGPVIDSLLANSLEDSTRAISLSFIFGLMYALTAPFGTLAGHIAATGARLTALFAAATMLAAILLTPKVAKE